MDVEYGLPCKSGDDDEDVEGEGPGSPIGLRCAEKAFGLMWTLTCEGESIEWMPNPGHPAGSPRDCGGLYHSGERPAGRFAAVL